MNANVIKSKLSFYTTTELKRTPASEENKRIREFIDGHEFTFQIDKDSKELRSVVVSREEN